jgi:hypothetical protein
VSPFLHLHTKPRRVAEPRAASAATATSATSCYSDCATRSNCSGCSSSKTPTRESAVGDRVLIVPHRGRIDGCYCYICYFCYFCYARRPDRSAP